MGAPALRALANAGITGPDGLKKWNEVDILALHGMGPKAMRSDFDLSWWLPNLYLLLYPIYFVQALLREKL